MQPHCRPSPAVRTNAAKFSPGGLMQSALWTLLCGCPNGRRSDGVRVPSARLSRGWDILT